MLPPLPPQAWLLTYQLMEGPGLADLTEQDSLSGPDQSEMSSGCLGLSWGPSETLSSGPEGMAGRRSEGWDRPTLTNTDQHWPITGRKTERATVRNSGYSSLTSHLTRTEPQQAGVFYFRADNLTCKLPRSLGWYWPDKFSCCQSTRADKKIALSFSLMLSLTSRLTPLTWKTSKDLDMLGMNLKNSWPFLYHLTE